VPGALQSAPGALVAPLRAVVASTGHQVPALAQALVARKGAKLGAGDAPGPVDVRAAVAAGAALLGARTVCEPPDGAAVAGALLEAVLVSPDSARSAVRLPAQRLEPAGFAGEASDKSSHRAVEPDGAL
jgi:hypothetical protein